MKLQASEELIHCAIADLLRFKAHPDLIWFHPANGEHRAKRTAAKLKRMGVQKGIPDFCFMLPSGRGAFLEVKAVKGRLTAEQLAFQGLCRGLDIPHAVVRSSQEAEDVLTLWGALRSPVHVQKAA